MKIGFVELVAVVSSVLALAVAVIPGAWAAEPQAQQLSTVITLVKPVDQYQVLKAGWKVVHRFYGGTCNEGSDDAIPGADRCFVTNSIYDPCWPTVNRYNRYNGSFCPGAPWSRSGILIKGRHHPANYATGKSTWGVQLAGGSRCRYVGGATDLYRGKRVNYACRNGVWLVGRPNTSARPWRILAVTYDGIKVTRHWTARLRHAWVAVSPYGV